MTAEPRTLESLDIDLSGLLRIRLVDPSPADVRVVERALGLPGTPAHGRPDVTIRYSERVTGSGHLRFVGETSTGFTDDSFVVIRGTGQAARRAIVPFERIGGELEIHCERGFGAPPHLVPIINLTLLGRGVLPLHAAAFVHRGLGIVAAGWSGSGKTEALLAFMLRGATYVADEWVYVEPETGRLHGLPTPIRLERQHLDQLPQLRPAVDAASRIRMQALGLADALEGALPAATWQRLPGGRVVRRWLAVAAAQGHVDLPPAALFGRERLSATATLDRVILLLPAARTDIWVESVSPEEVARRMVFAHVQHRLSFLDTYWRFRHGFPHASNTLIDEMAERERRLLDRALTGRPALRVEAPRPTPIARLYDALVPHLSAAGSTGPGRDGLA